MRRNSLLPISIGLLLLAAFLFALALSTGCQSGTTGPLRPIDPQTYSTITNVITIGTNSIAPALPAPTNWIVEAIGGIALSGLTVWQTLTHSTSSRNTAAIAQLKNGTKT